jgi:hypothetical protein
MAKAVGDAVLDAALDKIATANIMTACSAQPTTRTEAVTTYALADVAMSGGDYTKADAGGGGRQTTVAQKTGVTVDANGTATHVALCDGTTLLYVTTCTSQVLTSGNTMTFGSWIITLGDPT